jgi:hypothetical protein
MLHLVVKIHQIDLVQHYSQTGAIAGIAWVMGKGRCRMHTCKMLRPIWAMAYYRQGAALMLLKVLVKEKYTFEISFPPSFHIIYLSLL